jgi:hypothetical protein
LNDSNCCLRATPAGSGAATWQPAWAQEPHPTIQQATCQLMLQFDYIAAIGKQSLISLIANT